MPKHVVYNESQHGLVVVALAAVVFAGIFGWAEVYRPRHDLELMPVPRDAKRALWVPKGSGVRIPKGINVSWVQWLDCAASEAAKSDMHSFTRQGYQGRKSYRDPPLQSLCCFPTHGRCFRAVFDGRVPLPAGLNSVGVRADLVRSLITGPTYREIGTAIRALLASELGVEAGTVEVSTARTVQYTPAGILQTLLPSTCALVGLHVHGLSELHADYYENAKFTFSAILFLDIEANDEVTLIGGETGFVDELKRNTTTSQLQLTKGVVVEPRRGRLVLFSGGGENYHSAMEVVQGRRTALHMWFRCTCHSD